VCLAVPPGAVGTPIWFGFGEIGLGEANLRLTGIKAAIIVGLCTFLIAPLAAAFLVRLERACARLLALSWHDAGGSRRFDRMLLPSGACEAVGAQRPVYRAVAGDGRGTIHRSQHVLL
jgi:hypothetical protein